MTKWVGRYLMAAALGIMSVAVVTVAGTAWAATSDAGAEACQEWFTTNDVHVTEGRAYAQEAIPGCETGGLVWYAVGSDEQLYGETGSATNWLHSEDDGQTYHVRRCPANLVDADGDYYGVKEDCNDADPTINPGATEICNDGIDQDCDGHDSNGCHGPCDR